MWPFRTSSAQSKLFTVGQMCRGKEIQRLPDLRARSFFQSYGQMLFAGRKRPEFRMSDHYAGRNPGIGGYCLVASIASDNPRMRTADHAGQISATAGW